jgi:hypothetical protein
MLTVRILRKRARMETLFSGAVTLRCVSVAEARERAEGWRKQRLVRELAFAAT